MHYFKPTRKYFFIVLLLVAIVKQNLLKPQSKVFFGHHGRHGNDWEHVILTFKKRSGKWYLEKTAFHQHDGHYSRKIGRFDMEGNRPIVYVGKLSHGSYHADCQGLGGTWCPFYCAGGCGYWEDFRNNNGCYRFRSTNLRLLSSVTGKVARGYGRDYCSESNCSGKNWRAVKSAGCWQNST